LRHGLLARLSAGMPSRPQQIIRVGLAGRINQQQLAVIE
jgi:hypothetical protein